MKKLVLIDGNAIIHRSYHALPKTMSTRKGEQTNAIYGFTTTLIKVLENLKPQYLAVSFDLAGPTFRHTHFADYKATRVKADQELYDQIPRVKQIVETMNIPIYEKAGFEADDCLGTVVEKLKDVDVEIYIVSGDKDIYQLVNGKVYVYSLRKGLNQLQVVDHDTIKREYNLDPHDFIDLKALAGDASDNIPGVPGIGAKTATDLIQKFDTLEGLYENLDSENIKPRIRELLKVNKDKAFMSQKLATIHRDVPLDFSLEECKWGEYDKEKLRSLFEELGFQSLLRRFSENGENNKSKDTEEAPKTEVEKKDKQLKLL
jgi:DNA polymerase-1